MITVIRIIGDVLLAPFSWMPPLLAVLTLSAACGVLFLLAFRVLSPQKRLQRVKDLMSASIYEMRIFSNSLTRVFAAQGRALGLTLIYLGLTLPALLVLFVPLVGLVARAATYYEYQPLQVGQTATLTLSLNELVPRQSLKVKAVDSGVEVRPPLIISLANSEAYVRVRGLRQGVHRLSVQAGKQSLEKTVTVGPRGPPVSPYIASSGAVENLLSHEAGLSDPSVISKVSVAYTLNSLSLLGLPWYMVLLVVSLIVAFALRRPLGVVF